MLDYKNVTEHKPFDREYTRGQVLAYFALAYFALVLPVVVDAICALMAMI